LARVPLRSRPFFVGDDRRAAGIFDDVSISLEPAVIDRQEDRSDMAHRESDIEKCALFFMSTATTSSERSRVESPSRRRSEIRSSKSA